VSDAAGDDLGVIAEIDATMMHWRQGDVIRPAVFTYLADTRHPGTPPSRQAADRQGGQKGPTVVRTAAAGLVVISQTCDIVAKSALVAPFVNTAALVELDGDAGREAAAGDRPRYVPTPQLGDQWFADLDQVQTVEKAFLLGHVPERGVGGDEEQAAFGAAVGRRFSRFAFPDDLHAALDALQRRVKSRHRKGASPEGRVLRQVRQIRVEADPDWNATEIAVTLTFLLPPGALPIGEDPSVATAATSDWLKAKPRPPADLAARLDTVTDPGDLAVLWDHLTEGWAAICTPTGVVVEISAEVLCADEYPIARAWRSQRLDLDYLSGPTQPE
jgi:hypothetical protein